ncbi:hypothetical protein SAMN05443637_13060 [Pseudonocardia thermophila]|jgi:hypothetical protein|uniref:Helix-turn-helix domain-containing protein n=1 Tax=Pseudonocardia thermophila TaxID=1848 RepID=A0A1M7AXB9_PSETH|nr:hypothetical protein [Pseudonocardia thermophila]SHL47418.1 hypothetical protein SAMN05443637_13060 [Pseudonocardia thermophila]
MTLTRHPHPRRRLDDADVRAIREMRAAGKALADIAARYNISLGYVSDLVNGRARQRAGGPIVTERIYARRAA